MIYKEFTTNLIEKKKAAAPENMAQMLYAHASVGYHNQEFFEQTFIQFKDSETTPDLATLGYLSQAASTLRGYEYTALLIKWFDDNLSSQSLFDYSQPWRLKNEFSFSQTLMGIA